MSMTILFGRYSLVHCFILYFVNKKTVSSKESIVTKKAIVYLIKDI